MNTYCLSEFSYFLPTMQLCMQLTKYDAITYNTLLFGNRYASPIDAFDLLHNIIDRIIIVL